MLIDAARQRPAGLLDVQPTATGMHLVAWLPVGIDDRAAARAAADADVETVPLSTFRVGAPGRPGLALGFASSSVPDIQAATERLACALELLSRRPKTSRR